LAGEAYFSAPLEYWLSGDGVTVRGQVDRLYEGENNLDWFLESWEEPTISGSLVDNPQVSLRHTGMRSSDERGEHWRSTVAFPAPGCWQLQAEAGAQSLDAIVYVYPAACRVQPGLPPPASCGPPEV
jgi:hypothetical protein